MLSNPLGGNIAITDLTTTAEALVAPGKGILPDENTNTIARRSIDRGETTEANSHT